MTFPGHVRDPRLLELMPVPCAGHAGKLVALDTRASLTCESVDTKPNPTKVHLVSHTELFDV